MNGQLHLAAKQSLLNLASKYASATDLGKRSVAEDIASGADNDQLYRPRCHSRAK
jgi:hypothetical protein